MTAPVRKPALHLNLPPTLGVDPGARWTAVTLRIGQDCPAAETVLNHAQPRPGAHKDLIPADPKIVTDVVGTIGRLLKTHDAAARSWWSARGHEIPSNVTPFLLAVEKCREPIVDPSRGLDLRSDVIGSYAATLAVTLAVFAILGEGARPVAPHKADDRWVLPHGTGSRADYWPVNLLDPIEGGVTDLAVIGSTDAREPLGHVRAAWHIASDAAQDHVRRHGVQPPHEVYGGPVLLPALHTLLGGAVRPVERVEAEPGPLTPATADAARTTRTALIPAPRSPEPDAAEVLAEIRRLVAAATAASRPVHEVVREHVSAADAAHVFDGPAAWSRYSARRTALLAAAATRVA